MCPESDESTGDLMWFEPSTAHSREFIVSDGLTVTVDVNDDGMLTLTDDMFAWLMEQAGFEEVVVPRD